jgi:hypothetical protein
VQRGLSDSHLAGEVTWRVHGGRLIPALDEAMMDSRVGYGTAGAMAVDHWVTELTNTALVQMRI